MFPQAAEEGFGSAIVDRRCRLINAVSGIFGETLYFENERGSHQQRIAVRAFVFSGEDPNQLTRVVFRVAAFQCLRRTALQTIILRAPFVLADMARRHVDSYRKTAQYFRDHDVRVVNMSWGWSYEEVRSSLEVNGIGESAEERKEMAKEIFGILSDGLHEALASCPQILFLSAAGNEDADVEFDEFIPSSYDDLDNLLVVGAKAVLAGGIVIAALVALGGLL